MSKYFISKPVMITALGRNTSETMENILKGEQKYFLRNEKGLLVGRVRSTSSLKETFNQILDNSVVQLKDQTKQLLKHFDKSRIGVAIGGCDYNSQAAIFEHKKHLETNSFGDYNVDLQNPFRPSEKVANLLGLEGPVFSIASACASGLYSIIKGIDLLEAGDVDAMLVGGIDFSSDLITSGFASLSAVSKNVTNPFSANREGITLGDGSGLFFITKLKVFDFPIAITGFGESSDGYNMTSPDPEGKEVINIINSALEKANLKPKDIGYICLHGTGTKVNDAMEANAVYQVFRENVKISSIKALIGHCLGAAGAINTGVTAMTLFDNKAQLLPPHINDGVVDSSLPNLDFVKLGDKKEISAAMCMAFAFGGANAVVVLERI